MKILILNWKDIKNPQVGGAEIIVYELAKRLVKDGNKVTWFCGNFSGGKSEETIEGITIVRRGFLVKGILDLFEKGLMYLYAPFYYWSLKVKPDLVIDMSNTIYWQTPLWAFKSKKVAYLNQFAKEVFYFEYPPIIAHIGAFIERIQYLTYLDTDFICYSTGTKKDLQGVGINPDRIRLFSLGLDKERYTVGKKSKTPLFACVNRLVKMKRTDLVVLAMRLVCKKYPSARLVISGSGYEREHLGNLIEDLDLSKNVQFLDKNTWFFEKNNKDQKVKLMQEAWALVFPSVKEGWGMTVTECGACGTPTIATRVTGLEDSVIDGKTGILVSSNPTAGELSKTMIKIIEDRTLREKLSKGALEFSKSLSWDRSYGEFWSMVKEITEK